MDHTDTRFNCEYCDASYKQLCSLNRHCDEKHSGKSYVCPTCSFHSFRQGDLPGHFKRRHPGHRMPEFFKTMSSKELSQRITNLSDKSKKTKILKRPDLLAQAPPARVQKVLSQIEAHKQQHSYLDPILRKTAPRTATSADSSSIPSSSSCVSFKLQTPAGGLAASTILPAKEGIAAFNLSSAERGIAASTIPTAEGGIAASTSSTVSTVTAAQGATETSSSFTSHPQLGTILSVPSPRQADGATSQVSTALEGIAALVEESPSAQAISTTLPTLIADINEVCDQHNYSGSGPATDLADDSDILDLSVNINQSPLNAIADSDIVIIDGSPKISSPARSVSSTTSELLSYTPPTSEARVEVLPVCTNSQMFRVLEQPVHRSTPLDYTIDNTAKKSPYRPQIEDISEADSPEKLNLPTCDTIVTSVTQSATLGNSSPEPSTSNSRSTMDRASSPVGFNDQPVDPDAPPENTTSDRVTRHLVTTNGDIITFQCPKNYSINFSDGTNCQVQ